MVKAGEGIKFPVIIPSAYDDAGIVDDYFELGNLNLLPLGGKTLIQYLLDDLQYKLVSKYIGNIYLVVSEKVKHKYDKIIGPRDGVEIIEQAPYQRQGIFACVDYVIKMRNIKGPFLIIYGDTIVQDQVLLKIVNEAANYCRSANMKLNKWSVVGFAELEGSQLPYKDKIDGDSNKDRPLDVSSVEKNPAERNRWGYIIVNDNCIKRAKKGKRFSSFNFDAIQDIIYRPSYPGLHKCKYNQVPLVETGVMVLSSELWSLFNEYNKSDPLGLRSIINSARYSSINDQFTLKGIIFNQKSWLDINYPWEYLKASNYLMQRAASFCDPKGLNYKEGKFNDLTNTGYTIVKDREQLFELFGKSQSEIYHEDCEDNIDEKDEEIPDDQFIYGYTNEYDERKVWGIHPDAKVDGYIIVPNPKHEKMKDAKIFIGKGSHIRGNCVIKPGVRIRNNAIINNSVIGKNVLIDSSTLIDHSVILDNSNILTDAVIPYSIVGENTIIGGKTIVACERLERMKAKNTQEDIDIKQHSKLENSNDEQSLNTEKKFLAKYYASANVIRHRERFGAIIGDQSLIGVTTYILPGRKIGRESKIAPGSEIIHNCPPGSIIETPQRITLPEFLDIQGGR